MALQRIWGLIARFRRRIILTGIVVGGGYAVYNWKRSAVGNAVGSDNEKKVKASAARFVHLQEVSDKRVKAFVADGASRGTKSILSDKHNSHFRVSEIGKEAQQDASDQARKTAALQSLTNEIFARALSSVCLLCALVMTHRVESNILCRRMYIISADGDVAFSESQAFARHISEDAGLRRLAESARKGVRRMVAEAKLTPKTKVSASELVKHFSDASAYVYSELFTEAGCADTFLPGNVQAGEAQPLLEEARKALDGSQFVEVFQNVVATVMGLVLADLANTSRAGPGPLEGGGGVARLSTLLGRMTDISNSVLGAEAVGESGHIERAASVPALKDFCESLYFQEDAFSPASDPGPVPELRPPAPADASLAPKAREAATEATAAIDAPAGAKPCRPDFAGKWECTKAEGIEDMLVLMGMSFMKRKAALTMQKSFVPKADYQVEGDGDRLRIANTTPKGVKTLEFATDGQEFDGLFFAEQKPGKGKAWWDGDTLALVVTQPEQVTEIRRFLTGGELIELSKVSKDGKEATVTRTFTKA